MNFQKLLASPKLIAGAVVGFLALVMVIATFSSFNGTQKDMVNREQRLSAQYQDNQNELSAYISTVKESLGVAESNTAALDEVLANAIKGRYDGDNAAMGQGGAFFSAITEAYPQLDAVSLPYQKVQEAVMSGRMAYKNKQTKLLDMLREYETWKNSGFIHSKMTSMVGAPSDNLVARVGTNTSRGQDALDKMYLIVLDKDTKQAYDTGELEPMDLGPKSDR